MNLSAYLNHVTIGHGYLFGFRMRRTGAGARHVQQALPALAETRVYQRRAKGDAAARESPSELQARDVGPSAFRHLERDGPPLSQFAGRQIQILRRSRHSSMPPLARGLARVYCRHGAAPAWDDSGQGGQQRQLRTKQLSLGHKCGAGQKPAAYQADVGGGEANKGVSGDAAGHSQQILRVPVDGKQNKTRKRLERIAEKRHAGTAK